MSSISHRVSDTGHNTSSIEQYSRFMFQSQQNQKHALQAEKLLTERIDAYNRKMPPVYKTYDSREPKPENIPSSAYSQMRRSVDMIRHVAPKQAANYMAVRRPDAELARH